MNTLKKLASRLKDNPQDSFAKFALALECLKYDKLDKALTLFKSIEQEDPDYVGVYYHLGKLYEKRSENNKAKSTYKKGIEIAASVNDWHTKSELQSALMNLEIEEYE